MERREDGGDRDRQAGQSQRKGSGESECPGNRGGRGQSDTGRGRQGKQTERDSSYQETRDKEGGV